MKCTETGRWLAVLLPVLYLRHGCLASQGFYNPWGAQPYMRWTGQLNGLYYAMGDIAMNYCEARHLCAQQPGNSHLAILDHQDDFDAVMNLLANHYQSVLPVQFWLDATRPSGTGNYTWANGRVLPLSSDKWPGEEPQETETGMRLKMTKVDRMSFMGYPHDSGRFPPLCQSDTVSVQPPIDDGHNFAWVLLGNPTQVLGFSGQPEGLDDAKNTCETYNMSLVNLDSLYEEVTTYIQDEYTGETYWWVNVTGSNVAGGLVWSEIEAVTATTLANAGTPSSADYLFRLRLSSDSYTSLTRHDVPDTPSLFICQQTLADTPASPEQFSILCAEYETSTTVTSSPSSENPETSTTVTSSPSSENPETWTTMTSPPSSENPETTLDTLTSTDALQNRNTSVTQPNCCTCMPETSLNLTHQQLQEKITKTREELLLDIQLLSATIRRKVSTPDSRPTAKATGVLGIVILVTVFLTLVLPDVLHVMRACQKGSKQEVGRNEWS